MQAYTLQQPAEGPPTIILGFQHQLTLLLPAGGQQRGSRLGDAAAAQAVEDDAKVLGAPADVKGECTLVATSSQRENYLHGWTSFRPLHPANCASSAHPWEEKLPGDSAHLSM